MENAIKKYIEWLLKKPKVCIFFYNLKYIALFLKIKRPLKYLNKLKNMGYIYKI